MQNTPNKEGNFLWRKKRFVFSDVIADFIDEIRRDFEKSKPDNPLQWLEGALQRHCKVSEEDAKRIAKNY